MLKLSKVINREQLLHLALKIISDSEPTKEDPNAVNIVIWYIINEFDKKNESPTQEAIERRYSDLLTEFILEEMSKKGLIEPMFTDDGEIQYKATPIGISAAKKALENDEQTDF